MICELISIHADNELGLTEIDPAFLALTEALKQSVLTTPPQRHFS